ncbi:MAG: esterase [Flavobacteriia bacterium]|nr:esterase [Flavobacteriia bacterium]
MLREIANDDLTPKKHDFIKQNDSIWTYTTKPLPSDLYRYRIVVDGVQGLDPNNAYAYRDVATLANYFIVGQGRGDLYKVQNVPHGTLRYQWYHSKALGKNRRMAIYTPPGYESFNKAYPVLYLLHGAGGDEEAWITGGRVVQILDNLIALGNAHEMIVVMPNGNAAYEATPGLGSDGMHKPLFMAPRTMDGSFISSFPEIIEEVENHFRVKKTKQNRAIAGLSMGGFHSVYTSANFPNTFDYVGAFSSALVEGRGINHSVFEQFDQRLKQQIEHGVKLYWVGIGKTDFLDPANQNFIQKLTDLELSYTYLETEGGHTWSNWRHYLSEFVTLLFLNKTL